MYPLHAVYPTWRKCETCSLWCETTRYLATTLCIACALHKQDSSQGYIHQQFQMIFWIRNDTVISIYALICLLLGGIDGNQLRKGVHRPFWDHNILLIVEYSLLRGLWCTLNNFYSSLTVRLSGPLGELVFNFTRCLLTQVAWGKSYIHWTGIMSNWYFQRQDWKLCKGLGERNTINEWQLFYNIISFVGVSFFVFRNQKE